MLPAAAFIAAILGCRLASVGGAPSRADSSFVHFESHRAPLSFKRVGDAPRSHTITLRIGLKQPRIAELEQVAYAIADPTSHRYGAHLSDEEADTFAGPPAQSVETVAQWLESHGVSGEWSKARDWVVLQRVPISKAEEMLDTKYDVFQHDDGEHLIRTESYSLPRHLHQHVELIQPTTMFGRLTPGRRGVARIEEVEGSQNGHFVGIAKSGESWHVSANGTVPPACDNPREVKSACLRQLYGTYGYIPKATKRNALALTGYLNEYAQYDDLAMFLELQRPDQANYTFKTVSVAGGVNVQGYNSSQIKAGSGIEANLDVQTAAGITAPTPNIFYTTPGSPPFNEDLATPTNNNEPYLVWLDYMLNLPKRDLPPVISTSYGDDEQTVPESYARRVCSGLAQLGARGVSLLFSSGDFGVGADGKCISNDGRNRTTWLPLFPSTCPFVTSVGGTENFAPEQAVSKAGPGGYFAGGGFSGYFQVPEYQLEDTSQYVKALGGEYRGLYNPGGRGYPDVAAQGADYLVAYNHKFTHVYGTSAACPTFASVITLLNDYRLSRGKPVLGFLNPWLYAVGRRGLNDILIGSSAGCNTTGFPAKRGWDAVTGLGTPKFKELQKLLP